MKIIYLHQYFRTPAMSGGTRSYELARRLVERGHEVHLVTSDTDPQQHSLQEPSPQESGRRLWRVTVEAGIQVHWTPVPYGNGMPFAKRIKAFRDFAWRSAHRAAALQGDLVFATSTPLTIALPGIYASLRSRVPLVLEVRDLWPDMPIAVGALKSKATILAARALEWLAYHRARSIVALSPGIKEGIMRRGIAADRITVIPNACDFDLFTVPAESGAAFRREHAWLQDRPLVVYTGTLGIINGVGYLARLAGEAARINPEVRFLIVGTGQQESAIRQQAADLGVLDRNFFMIRQVAKTEIPKILSAADLATSLFNKPEMGANSANKFFDSLAAGRAIAINHGGWLADLITQRQLGLVLHPVDVATAARDVVDFVTDPQRVARTGRTAGQVGRELFEREQLAGQLEDVLLDAAGRTTARDAQQSMAKAA